MMCVLAGTDYNSRSADGDHKPNMNIYKCFATLKAYKRNNNNANSTVEFNSVYPGINLPETHYNMFDLDHEMYRTKFQSFDNIKIMNGKIMQAQVHKILNAHQTNTRAL